MNNIKLISLGRDCTLRDQIDKYSAALKIPRSETHFFDWLLVDFNTVITILRKSDNIEELISAENFYVDPENPNHGRHARLCNKKLSRWISIHDIEGEATPAAIEECTEKYRRRHARLVDLIKGYKDGKIYFFHENCVIEPEGAAFAKAIKDINPNCNFKLITLGDTHRRYSDNHTALDLVKYQIRPIDPKDWHKNYYDWHRIFQDAIE